MNYKSLLGALVAVSLATTSVLATGIPVGCSDGTREEPVPPTIIPGYTEDVPDILHPEQVIENPDKIIVTSSHRWNVHAGREVCVKTLWNGEKRRDISYQPDCLTMWDTRSGGSSDNKHKRIRQPDTIVEASVEVTPDIEHPEQVIENPPVIVPTVTVKWLVDVSGPWWDPTPVYDYTTHDGSCP